MFYDATKENKIFHKYLRLESLKDSVLKQLIIFVRAD